MSLTLYFDENAEGPVFDSLKRIGIDVRRVQDEGQSHTPDPLILDRALANGWVIFTMDEDFLAEAHMRQENGIPFNGIIYARKQQLSFGVMIQNLRQIASSNSLDDYVNRVQYLPLRK